MTFCGTSRPAIASSSTKSYLSHANGNCVEVADLPERHVGMRESKDAAGWYCDFHQKIGERC